MCHRPLGQAIWDEYGVSAKASVGRWVSWRDQAAVQVANRSENLSPALGALVSPLNERVKKGLTG